MSLDPAQTLAARVIDCLLAVSPRNLAHEGYGSGFGVNIGIPRKRLQELAAELELQYPGALARAREIQDEQQQEREGQR